MNIKRTILLAGAGAVLAYPKAPSTKDLTELILDSGFFMKGNKIRITKYISEQLKAIQIPEKKVNFETILGVVEEFIIYYSKTDNEAIGSIQSGFFHIINEGDLLNYTIVGNPEHNFSLNIPEHPIESEEHSVAGATPSQFFFMLLLSNLLTQIANLVSHYSWHTSGHSVVMSIQNQTFNENFFKWAKRKTNDGLLSLYTLNYDSNFLNVLRQGGIDVFDGFTSDSNEIPAGMECQPDLRKIYDSQYLNIHYNLHGSSEWRVTSRDVNQLPNPFIVKSSGISLQTCGYEIIPLEIERGKPVIVSNIIAGIAKTQKSFLTPFRQMQNSFDRDCMFADEIFIIGYSFSDEHINLSLKSAFFENPDLRITIIDPDFISTDMDRMLALNFSMAPGFEDLKWRNVSVNHYEYFGEKIKVLTMKFIDFLMSIQ